MCPFSVPPTAVEGDDKSDWKTPHTALSPPLRKQREKALSSQASDEKLDPEGPARRLGRRLLTPPLTPAAPKRHFPLEDESSRRLPFTKASNSPIPTKQGTPRPHRRLGSPHRTVHTGAGRRSDEAVRGDTAHAQSTPVGLQRDGARWSSLTPAGCARSHSIRGEAEGGRQALPRLGLSVCVSGSRGASRVRRVHRRVPALFWRVGPRVVGCVLTVTLGMAGERGFLSARTFRGDLQQPDEKVGHH